ncbi:MAG: ABC transporter ATP-binding protein [Gammaproteobacteria bacterium]|nr:ABC transporter ATP-binding protein [Gammaproteobacteria bacterium]
MVELDASRSKVISLQSVSKQYGSETVVHNVDLNVQAGECVVLVGHNGAGKTTLMKLMLGLTRPTSGSVEVLGGDPVSNTAVAQHKTLGYLPESVAFYEAMTGVEVLKFYARLKSASDIECKNLLDLVGLGDASKRRVGTYSKGMRQRLGLAQAMLGDPQLLFLDEPTTGLDPLLRHHFYELIDGLHKQGVTSIISSHALNEVEARANRFIIMKAGIVVASGTLNELYDLAALPIQLRIAVHAGESNSIAERLGSEVKISDINNQSLNISCLSEDKMPLIRRISEFGEVIEDMQIMLPRLDEVYSHFMNGEHS